MPNYNSILTNFSKVTKLSSADVYKTVGGLVHLNYVLNPAAFSNACALRLSYALNTIDGHQIPFEKGKTVSGDMDSNGTKEWYYLKVADLSDYLDKTYGKAQKVTRENIKGKEGFIKLTDCNWSDATGHIDVWNGTTCVGTDYDVCSSVYFWEI